ncbi:MULTISPECIES: MerR family transcriptional regulator [Frankia]|uniref:Transcriptional regulator n=1 Tax=Frankia alni (strain DSM 45986 / CECT 9034 / ACN14a) TaxID=326424 RepID=Q0RGG2_FRAAA|nr:MULTISPECIES: MerR family transcriptional regulator [Frankia]CAJ63425.1 Putative transcriptional regulator [Frankia alni ACN14a]
MGDTVDGEEAPPGRGADVRNNRGVRDKDQMKKAARELCGIGQAAQELGVSVRALRYYQEVGLLTPSGRTSGGNRLYADSDLARVRRIRELQTLLGFNLDEIGTILAYEDRLAQVRVEFHAASDDGDRLRLLSEGETAYVKLRAEIDEKISRLAAFRDEIDERLERMNRFRDGAVARSS